jgi:hypothetical protein
MRLPAVRRTSSSADADRSEPKETIVSGLSRRLFLTRSSLTVVAAGVVSAMPALPAMVSSAEAEAPAAEDEVGESESLTAPLVAHVKNLQTGEVSLYSGEREISILDRGLAARLFNLAK